MTGLKIRVSKLDTASATLALCCNLRAWLLFIDLRSAFNSIQPHILFSKLVQLKVNPFLIRWYHFFLSDRPQQVKVNSGLSDTAVCSTGAPRGVLAHLFCLLYTSLCKVCAKLVHCEILWYSLTQFNKTFQRKQLPWGLVWCTQVRGNADGSVGDQGSVTVHSQEIRQVN